MRYYKWIVWTDNYEESRAMMERLEADNKQVVEIEYEGPWP